MMWPIQMVSMPRPLGQPISCCMARNSSSMDSPAITSGSTMGALTMAVNRVEPLNLR
ncbi:hypothetical protein D9M68_716070 [compost metagenome]